MLNRKTIVPFIGMVIGVIIIIIGFCVQGISIEQHHTNIGNDFSGTDIKFGADFYTEIYDVTGDVGHAINSLRRTMVNAIEGVLDAIGWLIVVIGATDACFFAYKFFNSLFLSENVENIHYQTTEINENVRIMATPFIREAEEQAKREAEEKAKREAEEKAIIMAKEKAKRDSLISDKRVLAEKLDYALKYKSDDGMIIYLKKVQNEAVQNILKSPKETIRAQIADLLNKL